MKQAFELIEKGMQAMSRGNVQSARDRFRESADKHLTAEALTYWAWMEHQLGNSSQAIRLCVRAIALDPDYGNPHYDLGAYHLSLGQHEEAIAWLKKAKSKTRFSPPQCPGLLLAKVYLAMGMPVTALKELAEAEKLYPNEAEIRKTVAEVRKLLQ